MSELLDFSLIWLEKKMRERGKQVWDPRDREEKGDAFGTCLWFCDRLIYCFGLCQKINRLFVSREGEKKEVMWKENEWIIGFSFGLIVKETSEREESKCETLVITKKKGMHDVKSNNWPLIIFHSKWQSFKNPVIDFMHFFILENFILYFII